MAATVPVQHRTLPEEGYNAASYLIGYGGSGHVICITFAFMVTYILNYWTFFWDMYIRIYIFMVEVCLFISYEVGCLKCYTSPLKLLSNEPIV